MLCLTRSQGWFGSPKRLSAFAQTWPTEGKNEDVSSGWFPRFEPECRTCRPQMSESATRISGWLLSTIPAGCGVLSRIFLDELPR